MQTHGCRPQPNHARPRTSRPPAPTTRRSTPTGAVRPHYARADRRARRATDLDELIRARERRSALARRDLRARTATRHSASIPSRALLDRGRVGEPRARPRPARPALNAFITDAYGDRAIVDGGRRARARDRHARSTSSRGCSDVDGPARHVRRRGRARPRPRRGRASSACSRTTCARRPATPTCRPRATCSTSACRPARTSTSRRPAATRSSGSAPRSRPPPPTTSTSRPSCCSPTAPRTPPGGST